MANKLSSCPYSLILLCTVILMLGSSSHGQAPIPPPANPRLTDLFPHLSFDHDFSQIFGVPNIRIYNNGSNANITLDKSSGSGLASKNKYNYGFFSASIKLPAGFTSGVVVAFYMSNADQYPHNHDEIDIELLGHQNHKDWVTQTNMYGNGSVSTGREEKFKLWFDPTAQFHDYSIIWNSHHIVFLVDNIPVREVLNTEAMSPSYPSKPMSVYATIWDASDWATHGGKYPVDYKYAPFTASIGTVEMSGCLYHPGSGPTACSKPGSDPSQTDPVDGQDLITLSQQQIQGLRWARSRMMIYSYCRDKRRYKVLPPECTTQ